MTKQEYMKEMISGDFEPSEIIKMGADDGFPNLQLSDFDDIQEKIINEDFDDNEDCELLNKLMYEYAKGVSDISGYTLQLESQQKNLKALKDLQDVILKAIQIKAVTKKFNIDYPDDIKFFKEKKYPSVDGLDGLC